MSVTSYAARPPSPLYAWLIPTKPIAVLMSMAPLAAGIASWSHIHSVSPFHVLVAAATLLSFALGARFLNDYLDAAHFVDRLSELKPNNSFRLGLHVSTVRRVGLASLVLVFTGLLVSALLTWPWLVLVAPTSAVAVGYLYAGGPRPLGHRYLGELVNFSMLGLLPTMWVQLVLFGHIELGGALSGIGLGFMVSTTMLLNNAGDVVSDFRVDKRTLPQRLGLHRTKVLAVSLLTSGLSLAVAGALVAGHPTFLVSFVVVPMAVGSMWRCATATAMEKMARERVRLFKFNFFFWFLALAGSVLGQVL